MDHTDAPPSLSLRHYLQVIQRGWLVVLVSVLAGTAAAGAFLILVPPQATASALVSLNVITADPFNASRPASALVDPQAEAQAATSWAVAEMTAEALGGDPSTIRQSLEVSPVGNTTHLRITSTHPDGEQARAIADATAASFLDYREQQARTRIERTLEQSLARLGPLQEELRQYNDTIARAEAGSPAAAQAEADRALTSAEITALFNTTAGLRAIDTAGGVVLNPAENNAVTMSPAPSLVMLTGVLAGLGFGVLLTFVVDAIRARVWSIADVTKVTGRPVLGELDERGVSIPVAGSDLPRFRAVREHFLAHKHMAASTGVCVVVDHSYAGRASDVAFNFAWTMAAAGLPVELVTIDDGTHADPEAWAGLQFSPADSDGRGQYMGQVMSSQGSPMLVAYVPRAHASDQRSLEPLTPEVRQRVEERRKEALLVIPLRSDAAVDTRLAAFRLADMAVLIVEAKQTSTSELAGTVGELRGFNTPLVGSVIVHHARTRQTGKGRDAVDKAVPEQANSVGGRRHPSRPHRVRA